MQFVSDLHIHGKYSRGCSTELTLANLEKYARMKGVNLLGTGDFTHPKWIEEIKGFLKEDGSGFLKTPSGFNFVLQTELSLIYSQDGKGRRIHNVVLAPDLDSVKQITDELLKRGRIDYDGRPIFKIPCPEFVEMMRNISEDIEIIPAHIWTPHFSLFGDYNQFNKVEDCFKDQTKHIHAMETGLSSDPAMNWRLSQLDKYQLVSFSDLHSFWPWRIGREATVFDINESYKDLLKAIRTGDGLKSTMEFWPHEGKYHFDGHRKCNVCLDPKEAMKLNKMCPVCGKQLTIGVAHRIEELADRPEGFVKNDAPDFKNLIPLSECVAGFLKAGIATKKVWGEYDKLIKSFNNENNILLNVPFEDLKRVVDEKLAEIIIKNREQKIEVQPGYDGVYGEPLFSEEDRRKDEKVEVKQKQTGLGEFC